MIGSKKILLYAQKKNREMGRRGGGKEKMNEKKVENARKRSTETCGCLSIKGDE